MASNILCKVFHLKAHFEISKKKFWHPLLPSIMIINLGQYDYDFSLQYTVFEENLIRFFSWMDLVLSVIEMVFLNNLIFSYQKLKLQWD